MRHSLLLASVLFLLAASAWGQSDVANNVPWSGYDTLEIYTGGFRSIVGAGGRLIDGSSSIGGSGGVFKLPADPALASFTIRFLQQNRTAADLKISTAGWISFNSSTENMSSQIPELRYTRSTFYPFYNKVLMVYWSNLVTSGAPQGGIYWAIDSIAGVDELGRAITKRYLAIEWVARRGGTTSSQPGRFQARLFAARSSAPVMNSEIELAYGPESIDQPPPTQTNTALYGAMVGIKNFGQVQGDPATIGDPNDLEKFMIIVHPDSALSPSLRTITRLRTMAVPGETPDADWYMPEWWASYGRYPIGSGGSSTSYASRFFHYAFPPMGGSGGRISYRMRPVAVDMGALNMTINGLDDSVANSFEPGASIQPEASFINNGAYTLYNVPIELLLYPIGQQGPVPTPESFSIDSIAPGEIVRRPLYHKKGYTLQTPGYYRIKAYVKLAADRYRANDTIVRDFIITPATDMMPLRILLPQPNTPPDFTTYRVNEPVPFLVRFRNMGRNRAIDISAGFQVANSAGVLVDSGSIELGSIMPGDSVEKIFFTAWKPTAPGRYYFRTFIQTPDDIVANDTLPARDAYLHSFDVLFSADLAVEGPPTHPHAPVPGSMHIEGIEIPLQATIINNGSEDASNVPARVVVYNGAAQIVFDTTIFIRMIPGGGGGVVQTFPSYTPRMPGAHCVTISTNHFEDAIRLNDTAAWCFAVQSSSGVAGAAGSRSRLEIHPSPARAGATINYHIPAGVRGRLTIRDIFGREVRSWSVGGDGAEERIVIDVEGITSGVYFVRLEIPGEEGDGVRWVVEK